MFIQFTDKIDCFKSKSNFQFLSFVDDHATMSISMEIRIMHVWYIEVKILQKQSSISCFTFKINLSFPTIQVSAQLLLCPMNSTNTLFPMHAIYRVSVSWA